MPGGSGVIGLDSDLFFDELNKIRILEPEASQKTQDLKDQCKDFVDNIQKFKSIADSFLIIVDTLAKDVEKEKMKAIGVRNLIKSMSMERVSKTQQMRALIVEKQMELERLKIQHDSLTKIESEQNDFIDQFSMTK